MMSRPHGKRTGAARSASVPVADGDYAEKRCRFVGTPNIVQDL